MAAHQFLERNDLSQMFLDQVVDFILKNTKGITIGQQGSSAGDPFTGERMKKTFALFHFVKGGYRKIILIFIFLVTHAEVPSLLAGSPYCYFMPTIQAQMNFMDLASLFSV